MKILQLCKKFPYPVRDGESLAVNNLAKALHELGCSISLLAMNTVRHQVEASSHISDLFFYDSIETVPVDNRIHPLGALLNLFSSESYHISRFVSRTFEQKLKEVLSRESFDIIQLETLYLAPYIPLIRQYSTAAIVMRAHNVEHEIWQRISQHTHFYPKRWYLKYLTRKLRRFEQEQLQHYDMLLPITSRDYERFKELGYKGEALVVPIGIDKSNYEPDYDSYEKPISLSFIGSLDWMPNQEGLQWFMKQIWSRLKKDHPDLTLHIAGRNTPDWVFEFENQQVKVYGEVEDAADFINRHSILVVPLLSGSGMRAKILEGMALGKIVLTTSIGIEGIDAAPDEHILLADTPEDFIKQIDYCEQQNGQLRSMGKKARHLVTEKYDNLAIAQQLKSFYKHFSVEAL